MLYTPKPGQLTERELTDFVVAVRHMLDAMHNLTVKWEDLDGMHPVLCEKYPFGVSFDELVWEAQAWLENLESHRDAQAAEERDFYLNRKEGAQ